jgi:hypothetical protein
LALYDRYLPQPLAGELNKFATKVGDEEIPTYPKASLAHMPDDELLKSIRRIDDVRNALLRQKMEAEAEQERRNGGGTASDETWNQWVLEAGDDAEAE